MTFQIPRDPSSPDVLKSEPSGEMQLKFKISINIERNRMARHYVIVFWWMVSTVASIGAAAPKLTLDLKAERAELSVFWEAWSLVSSWKQNINIL